MIIDEIFVGNNEHSKQQAIKQNLGEVILKDEHMGWCHGKTSQESDNDRYLIEVHDGRRELKLWYHDLNQLLVVRNYSMYNVKK